MKSLIALAFVAATAAYVPAHADINPYHQQCLDILTGNYDGINRAAMKACRGYDNPYAVAAFRSVMLNYDAIIPILISTMAGVENQTELDCVISLTRQSSINNKLLKHCAKLTD